MAKRKNLQVSKPVNPLFYVFFIGIILMSCAFMLKVSTNNTLAFKNALPTKTVQVKTSAPIRINIHSMNIDLEVSETTITNNSWEISTSGASHLSTSANPGEKGNIVIYAHNTNDRFRNLSEVKIGDKITLYSKENKPYLYSVGKILIVDPSQIDLLMPTKKEILTIYTCTGFADTKRLVLQAEPVK